MPFFRKKYSYEAFLSHALEDRDVIVTELYDRLDEAGVNVWYSANSLKTGEELQTEIERAIEASRFGVVVITKFAHDRPWPLTEYNWLQKKETTKIKVVLPVVHDMAVEHITWPGIQSKYCILSTRGMDFVVGKILEEINSYRETEKNEAKKRWWLLSSVTFIIALLVSSIAYTIAHDRPTDEQIKSTIDARIEKLINTVDNKFIAPFKFQRILVTESKIDSARLAFENYKSYYRNEYEFNNDMQVSRGRKNVEALLAINLVDLANTPGYGMDSLDIYWSTPTVTEGFRHLSFCLINKRSITYSIKQERQKPFYVVKVNYANNIQYIDVSLTTPPHATGTKRHEMTLLGTPPSETYYFEKSPDGEWLLTKVE